MRIFTLLALSLLTACGSPIVGEWKSDRELGNGEVNELFVLSDFTGTAEIFAAPAGLEADPKAYVLIKFDLDWEEKGEEFELDMECDEGPCDGNDFTMECEVLRLDDDREKLDCTADGRWEGYVFNWERVQ